MKTKKCVPIIVAMVFCLAAVVGCQNQAKKANDQQEAKKADLAAPVPAVASQQEAEGGPQVVPKTLRAGRFELLDENGKTRIAMGLTKDGPALTLFDENGKIRIAMGLTKDSPLLKLCDKNGMARAGRV